MRRLQSFYVYHYPFLVLALMLTCLNAKANNNYKLNDPVDIKTDGLLTSVTIPWVKNIGQYHENVLFKSNALSGTAFYTKDNKIVYSLPLGDTRTLVVNEKFAGNSLQLEQVYGEIKTSSKISYLLKKDPSSWQKNAPAFQQLNLKDVWNGINVNLAARGDNFEKLFYVSPGTNPDLIRMEVEGIDELSISNDGELILNTQGGSVSFTAPKAWQIINGLKTEVNVGYKIMATHDHMVYGFELGNFDPAVELIIDPLLASTFIGGVSSDFGFSMGKDGLGNVFVAGTTSSSDFPTTPGVFDETKNNGTCLFISKFNPELSTLLASTYLGSNMYNNSQYQSVSCLVDDNGMVYISGSTTGTGFPVTPGAYDEVHNGTYDIVIAKLSNDLSTIQAATYLGGSTYDYASQLGFDNSGNILIAGSSDSDNFPITPGAYNPSLNGGSDVVITRLSNDLTTLIHSTYLGGSSLDERPSVKTSSNGDVIVSGITISSNFPTTTGAYQETIAGSYDCFVTRLNSNLSNVIASTFLGGSSQEQNFTDLEFDANGNILVAGCTVSGNFPTTPGAYQESNGGNYDVFICKMTPLLNTLMASTYLGGNSTDGYHGVDVELNKDQEIIVSTSSASLDFPTTSNAYSQTNFGNYDFTISKLSEDFSQLIESTYIGGSTTDFHTSIIIDDNYQILAFGSSFSADFPTTSGAYDESHNVAYDGAVFRFILDTDLDKIPTFSQWGIITLGLLMLLIGVLVNIQSNYRTDPFMQQ